MTETERVGPTKELIVKGGIEQVESPDRGDRRIVTRRRQTLFDILKSRRKLTERHLESVRWYEALLYRAGFSGPRIAFLGMRVDGSRNAGEPTIRQIAARAQFANLRSAWPEEHRRLADRLFCGGESALRTMDEVADALELHGLRRKERLNTAKRAIEDILDLIAESPYRDDEIDA